jgi:hypothetical protein
LARSIIENECWESLDAVTEKLINCGIKEGIKAVSFMQV